MFIYVIYVYICYICLYLCISVYMSIDAYGCDFLCLFMFFFLYICGLLASLSGPEPELGMAPHRLDGDLLGVSVLGSATPRPNGLHDCMIATDTGTSTDSSK